MRRRLRDWPVTAFKYGLMTNQPIPEIWLAEHRRWCEVWNRLVEKKQELDAQYQEIFDASDEIGALKEQVNLLSEKKASLWEEIKQERVKAKARISARISDLYAQKRVIDEQLRALRGELRAKKATFKEEYQERFSEHRKIVTQSIRDTIRSSGLYWTHQDYLEQSFYQALKRGKPKFKSWFLKDICFVHRYTAGGASLDTLFRPNKRIYIEPINWDQVNLNLPQRQRKKQVHTDVHVTVCGKTMTFACVFHRPIPQAAIIKQITINGRWNGRGKIKWQMVITAEIPELPKRQGTEGRKVCALDLGWRVDKDRLRFSYLFDEHKDKKALLLPAKMKRMVKYQQAMDRKKSHIVNHLREYLADQKTELLGSGIDREVFRNWHVANIGRFRKIAIMCQIPEIKAIIFRELDKYDHIRLRKRNSVQRLVKYRQWFYYNMAHELCRKYHTIVTEDIGIKRMLMSRVIDEKEGRDTRIIQHYSWLVAPGEWRAILKKVAQKYGTQIVELEPAYTTLRCNHCGEILDIDESERQKLILTCPECGLQFDQDENAARNLLGAYFRKPNGTFSQKKGLRKY